MVVHLYLLLLSLILLACKCFIYLSAYMIGAVDRLLFGASHDPVVGISLCSPLWLCLFNIVDCYQELNYYILVHYLLKRQIAYRQIDMVVL